LCFEAGAQLPAAGEKYAYRGRPLIKVLEDLRRQGLNLIFSTAVVTEDLTVTVEPSTTDPRRVLEEILAPLGLEAKPGSGGSILVLRSSVPALGILRGRVVSASRGAPVAGASVEVPGAGARGVTRPDGTFEITAVPAGECSATISATGYVSREVGPFGVSPGSPRELLVILEALPSYVEEIVVTPGRHALVWEEHSARLSVQSEDAVLAPTLGGDVTRVIELLPGVAAPDNSGAFNVRGAEARDVSLVLDGLELYDPFHLPFFQSPSSFVDSKIVDSIDFLGGGFTAEFGDRHGGFVELSTALPEGPDRTAIEIGTINSRVTYATPLSNGSLLLSARAWYPEALTDTTELGEDGVDPRFADAYMKYSLALSPQTVLSLHGLLASDRLEFRESGGSERVEAEDRSGYLWLSALRSWSASLSSETVLSLGRLERARDGLSEPEDEAIGVDDQRTVDFFGLKHDMTWQAAESHLVRTGFQIRPLDADYRYAIGPAGDPAATTSTRLDPSGTSYGLYAAWRAALSDHVATELGVRWDRQTYVDDDQISPRLNALWRAGERTELRIGVGRFFQSQRIHELRVEDGETEFLPAELSRRIELTAQHRTLSGLRLRLDAYYGDVSRVQPRWENLFNPVELFPETEDDRVLVAPDHVRLRGVEMLLRGDPGRPFYWWASYAWSKAEDVVDGEGEPRSWDQTHALKVLAAWRRADRWSLSLSGTVRSGWPTTPVSAVLTTLPGGATEITPILGPRNSDRFPAYARLDAKVSRSFPLSSGRLRVDLEVANLTDRENVCCVDEFLYEPQPDGTVEVEPELNHWLGITPSLSILWEF
jgi:outer membrane receptor protein involved in Fe transport